MLRAHPFLPLNNWTVLLPPSSWSLCEGVNAKEQGVNSLSEHYYCWYTCFRLGGSPMFQALQTGVMSTRLREVPLQSRYVKWWDFSWMAHASCTSRRRPQTSTGDEHSRPLLSSLVPGQCAVGPSESPTTATPASKPLRPRPWAPRGCSGALATSS